MIYLRAIDSRRIGGILVPFNVIDRFGTWWNRSSDFALDLFRARPLFYYHLFDDLSFGRAGTVDDQSIRLREEGLYVEADLHGNGSEGSTRAIENIMTLVQDGRAAWSSGTMPHLVRPRGADRRGGYIERWPIVEATVAPVERAGSLPGTTNVSHVRAMLNDLDESELEDETMLPRSFWIAPGLNLTPEPEFYGDEPPAPNGGQPRTVDPPAPPPTDPPINPNVGDDVIGYLRAIGDRIGNLETQIGDLPTRQLPPGQQPPNEADVRVSSRWDGVSLLGMLVLDRARRFAHLRGWENIPHRDEEFMRSMVDKMRAISEAESRDDVRLTGSHLRAIDPEAYAAWNERIPYLRADEAMQSTLTGFGEELVPTALNSVAWFSFRQASRVAGLLRMFTMPTDPFEWPTVVSGPDVRRVLQPADQAQASIPTSVIPFSRVGTDKIVFTTGEIGAGVLVSRHLFEDSGVNTADTLAEQWTRQMADAMDYVLLNGHKSADANNISHLGTDPTNTIFDKVLTLNGLRKIGLIDNSGNNHTSLTTITAHSITAVQKLMGPRGIIGLDINNLAGFVDPLFMYKLLELDDFLTVDKIGDRAVLLTGQVGAWKGIPVIVSDQIENTDDDGKYPDSHDGNKGQLVLTWRPGIMVGRRRDLMMEADNVPHTNLFAMSGTARIDLQPMEGGTVGVGRNATV